MSDGERATEPAVPDVFAPPPHHPRFPLFDGLRAIAVLCVVVLHVSSYDGLGSSISDRLAAHLNLGVTIFFLISGFLLYRPFIAHRTGGPPPPRVLDYLRRRALRIFPAYWLVLTVVVLVPSLDATGGGTLVQQYLLVFSLSSSTGWSCAECVLPHTWSLVAEMTFYLALPLYVFLTDRIARGKATRTWVPAEMALLLALSLLSVALIAFFTDEAPALITGSFFGFGLWFALGMGLAVASVAIGNARQGFGDLFPVRAPGTYWMTAIALYILVALALPPSPFYLDREELLLAFVGLAFVAFLLLLPAITTGRSAGFPGHVLAARAVEWCGMVSYGVFLWHIVVIRVLTDWYSGWSVLPLLAATIAISLATASVSYYLLERPILRLKR